MQLAAQRERQEFELKRLRIQGEQNASLHSASRPSTTFRDLTVKPLEATDDIDVYLAAFERLLEANKWPKSEWDTRLVAALTGKAREAFTRMPISQSGDYQTLKEAILLAYNLTLEAHRMKLRSVRTLKKVRHICNSQSEYVFSWNVGSLEKMCQTLLICRIC